MSSFIETRFKLNNQNSEEKTEENSKIPLIQLNEYENHITSYYNSNYMNFLPPRSFYGKSYLSHTLEENDYPLFLYLTMKYSDLYEWLSRKKILNININDRKNRVSHFELIPSIGNKKISVYIHTFPLCFLCF